MYRRLPLAMKISGFVKNQIWPQHIHSLHADSHVRFHRFPTSLWKMTDHYYHTLQRDDKVRYDSMTIHQVFFNFRGDQLRYNFVSHLSDAFERQNIKFFVDKYEQRGKDIKNLFVRIQESSIALAIFSTRYPESKWCMDELVKMKRLVDQGTLQVIPIFYKVEPRDVKRLDGEFGENFWTLAKASNGNQIKKWKEALESISAKMGLSLGEESSEADFIKKIVEDVQKVIEAMEVENHVLMRRKKTKM